MYVSGLQRPNGSADPEIVVHQLHADESLTSAAAARQLVRAIMASADESRPHRGGLMSTMTEPLKWTKINEDAYQARSGKRLYDINNHSGRWNVGLSGADEIFSAKVNQLQPAETLEEAKQIAQGWEELAT